MKNINILAVLFSQFLFVACTSTRYEVKETMMPNGNWLFGVYSSDSCDQLIKADKEKKGINESQNYSIPLLSKNSLGAIVHPEDAKEKKECIELFKKSLSDRSKELCGNERYSLYGCTNMDTDPDTSLLHLGKSDFDSSYKIRCYLNCNEKNN